MLEPALAEDFRSAVRELLAGRADLAAPRVARLLAAAPDDPRVRQLAQQAAIVSRTWSARRAPAPAVARALPASGAIDLVSFHIDLPEAPSGLHSAADYMAALALSFESARLRAPSARRVLLTDTTTVVPSAVDAHEVRRCAMDARSPMFERMRVQRDFLLERASGRLTVFIDSDVVVNADPAAMFDQVFDVGLTWRPGMADAPFNGGVIAVAEGDAGARFFGQALACYRDLAGDTALGSHFSRPLAAWWGDQFALALSVGLREFAERAGEFMEIDGVRVRFLPCSEFNFTLEAGRTYELQELARKRFIHFKGNRKGMQAAYLEHMRAGRL